MSNPVALDSGPLGLVTNPKGGEIAAECKAWLKELLRQKRTAIIPAIADYETRRELIRANKQRGLRRLEHFRQTLDFLPVTQESLDLASELWAKARREGKPTADDKALDGDMILAAQVLLLDEPDAIIATTNPAHLSLFLSADLWQNIK